MPSNPHLIGILSRVMSQHSGVIPPISIHSIFETSPSIPPALFEQRPRMGWSLWWFSQKFALRHGRSVGFGHPLETVFVTYWTQYCDSSQGAMSAQNELQPDVKARRQCIQLSTIVVVLNSLVRGDALHFANRTEL